MRSRPALTCLFLALALSGPASAEPRVVAHLKELKASVGERVGKAVAPYKRRYRAWFKAGRFAPSAKTKLVSAADPLGQALAAKALWHAEEAATPAETSPAPTTSRQLAERRLDRTAVFAVDAQTWRERRVLRTPASLRRDAAFLADRLNEIPGWLPRDLGGAELPELLAQTRAFVGARKVLARPGLVGVADLLGDSYVKQWLARRGAPGQELVERLTKAARAIQTVDVATLELERPQMLPLELQVLLAEKPALKATLAALKRSGVDVRFQRLERTPDDVLEAIARISVASQENFVTTWLPQLVQGRRPVLTPTEQGLKRAAEMGLLSPEGMTPQQLQQRLEADAELIERAVPHYLRFVASGPGRTAALEGQLGRLNAALDGMRRSYTAKRMSFDNADERTHEAQQLIKKMVWVGGAAHTLELMHLGPLAKFVAGSLDDLMGEWAELKALGGSGFSKQERLKRLIPLVPVFGLASWGLTHVDPLLHEGKNLMAGTIFGFSAVALSLTTAVLSVGMYKHGYEVLLKEGKLPDKVSVLALSDPFQAQLKVYEAQSRGWPESRKKAVLLGLARKHLTALATPSPEGGKVVLSAASARAALERLATLDSRALAAQVRRPAQLERWWAAMKQDFSNPARMGILVGSALAPVAGITASCLGLMHNGFIMAGGGMVESLGASGTVMAADRLMKARYKRELTQRLHAVEKAQVPSAPRP